MSSVQPTAIQPRRPGLLANRIGRRVWDWLPALVVLAVIFAAWQESIDLFHIKKFLAPQPTTIASTFWTDRGQLLRAGWFTFQEALGGYAIGCGLALVVGLVLARWRGLGRALLPYAIAANAIPIIAFAPIADAWFSPFSKTSKMVIAAVLCFFPVLVNTLRGLTSVRPSSIELMRSYAAGEVEIFRRVRIPSALPFVFTALKISSVLAMIGAIVGEYFGGDFNALGVLINSKSSTFDFKEAWAGIAVACAFGIAFYLAVALVERLSLRWVPSTSE
ncbi:MAG TPA: ABC transporter permease [Gaiellaceae bacterium]|jgi:NitT/TauT family transport system permease protein